MDWGSGPEIAGGILSGKSVLDSGPESRPESPRTECPLLPAVAYIHAYIYVNQATWSIAYGKKQKDRKLANNHHYSNDTSLIISAMSDVYIRWIDYRM